MKKPSAVLSSVTNVRHSERTPPTSPPKKEGLLKRSPPYENLYRVPQPKPLESDSDTSFSDHEICAKGTGKENKVSGKI